MLFRSTTRALPAYDENGEYFYFQKRKWGTISPEYYRYNILNELENSSYNQRGSALSVTANLQFSLINWLKANVIASYQTSNTMQESWWGEQTNYAAKLRGTEYGVLPAPRTEGEDVYKRQVLYFRPKLSYSIKLTRSRLPGVIPLASVKSSRPKPSTYCMVSRY